MIEEEEECPICLEPLTGTIVTLGCCRNKIHIQCYLEKCPLCRAPLPHPRPPEHIIVPIPVPRPEPTSFQKFIYKVLPLTGFLCGIGLILTVTQNTVRG
jgi:hypothetical protein